MIDWNRVAELKADVGAEDFADVIEIFLEEVEGVLASLTGVADPTTLDADLHFLKGSALNIGFHDLAVLCADCETLSAAGRSCEISVVEISQVYGASKAAFLSGRAHGG